MELAGKVIAVLNPEVVFLRVVMNGRYRNMSSKTHDQYPRRMCFDVFGADKIQQFNIQVGEELNVFLI